MLHYRTGGIRAATTRTTATTILVLTTFFRLGDLRLFESLLVLERFQFHLCAGKTTFHELQRTLQTFVVGLHTLSIGSISRHDELWLTNVTTCISQWHSK